MVPQCHWDLLSPLVPPQPSFSIGDGEMCKVSGEYLSFTHQRALKLPKFPQVQTTFCLCLFNYSSWMTSEISLFSYFNTTKSCTHCMS